MAGKITSKITQNNIEAALKRIEAEMEAAQDDAAEKALELARKLAPVDTGFMRDSIVVTKPGPMSRSLRAVARYSYFVEYGTRKMAARPFLAPALFLYRSLLEKKFKK